MATVTQTLESANAQGKPIKLAVAYNDKIHNSVSLPQEEKMDTSCLILIYSIVQVCSVPARLRHDHQVPAHRTV